MSRPVPSPSMNGIIGLFGTLYLPPAYPIFLPSAGTATPLYDPAIRHPPDKIPRPAYETPNYRESTRNEHTSFFAAYAIMPVTERSRLPTRRRFHEEPSPPGSDRRTSSVPCLTHLCIGKRQSNLLALGPRYH